MFLFSNPFTNYKLFYWLFITVLSNPCFSFLFLITSLFPQPGLSTPWHTQKTLTFPVTTITLSHPASTICLASLSSSKELWIVPFRTRTVVHECMVVTRTPTIQFSSLPSETSYALVLESPRFPHTAYTTQTTLTSIIKQYSRVASRRPLSCKQPIKHNQSVNLVRSTRTINIQNTISSRQYQSYSIKYNHTNLFTNPFTSSEHHSTQCSIPNTESALSITTTTLHYHHYKSMVERTTVSTQTN